MPDKKRQRDETRARQSKEIEENQAALRRSIAESQRLVEEAGNIMKRHRREQDANE